MFINAAYAHFLFAFTSINFCPARFNQFHVKFNIRSGYSFKIVGHIQSRLRLRLLAIGVIKIIAFDSISILEIDFSLNLVSVIPSISTLDSGEQNSSSRRFRFLDRLLILQWRIESRFCLRIQQRIVKTANRIII